MAAVLEIKGEEHVQCKAGNFGAVPHDILSAASSALPNFLERDYRSFFFALA